MHAVGSDKENLDGKTEMANMLDDKDWMKVR